MAARGEVRLSYHCSRSIGDIPQDASASQCGNGARGWSARPRVDMTGELAEGDISSG